jgi:hypothetical protein
MARARMPWGNGRLLPAGPLREPLTALCRAGLIVVTGALFGLLLYPAGSLDAIMLLFVPWQAAVAASIGHGLTRGKA